MILRRQRCSWHGGNRRIVGAAQRPDDWRDIAAGLSVNCQSSRSAGGFAAPTILRLRTLGTAKNCSAE